jgi:RsiW-degrading membrane proteinase PrsW (M82 family)
MPISVACDGCGKRFKAPDHGAGKQVPCPACKSIIKIPAAADEDEEDIEYRLQDVRPTSMAPMKLPATTTKSLNVPSSATSTTRSVPAVEMPSRPSPNQVATGGNAVAKKAWVPTTRSSAPSWQRHLHWCLAFAMIPLAVSIFVPQREFAEPTIVSANDAAEPTASPSIAPPVGGQKATTPSGKTTSEEPTLSPEEEAKMLETLGQLSKDELLALMPGKKLPGAFLASDTSLHWVFALVAAAAYLTFLALLASDKAANPVHLLGLGVFTATVGIFLLLAVQFLSHLGSIRVRGGIIGLIFLVLLLIGLSYSAANDPEISLIPSFLGFTFGVGLCEEVCKALPVLAYYRSENKQTWRGAFLWGMASGVGFGVSEGIMYSQDFYNGIAGPSIYLVRFVSCVALHAIWSGSVAISINQRQYLLQEDHDDEDWWMYGLAILQLIAIPMVLHGMYDTLLKKNMEFLALVTAATSFGYLAWQISHLRNSDEEDERAAYVANYIRSKAAAQGA